MPQSTETRDSAIHCKNERLRKHSPPMRWYGVVPRTSWLTTSRLPASDRQETKVTLDKSTHDVYNVSIVAELLGAFEQAILLAVWNLADEAYGRAILRSAESSLDRQAAAGAVYATLDRLEQKGLGASRLEEGTPARAGRARRYYRVTAIGIKALNESKAAIEQMWRAAQWPLESKA